MRIGPFILLLALITPIAGHLRGEEPNLNGSAQGNVPKELLGTWRNENDKREVIHFESTRCVLARLGRTGDPQFMRVTCKPGKIVMHSWGRKTRHRIRLQDGVLALTHLPDGKTATYRKLDKVPPEVQVKPLSQGQAKAVPQEQVGSIRQELARRAKLDQDVRTDPAKVKGMAKVDADNTAYLCKLVREVGWIDAQRFGKQACGNAFLIVQHSGNLPLMMAALPAIEKDVKAKRVDGQFYALLYDRLQVTLGGQQRYGTQLGTDEKEELMLISLEDRGRVDQWRKELGMMPLADYLKYFDKQNGGKPIKFEDDE